MSKKKIIIVGGSGSIGSAIAKEVINEGFNVTIVGRNYFTLEKISKELNCSFVVADVTNTKELENSLSLCGEDVFGLVYCAGSINIKSLTSAHENDYIDSYRVNTLGAVTSIRCLKEVLLKNKGSVLLFSSVAARQGFTNHTIISTSKAAIEGLTVSLAAELSPCVRVNCIAPSLTESEMTKSIIANQNIKKAIESLHAIPKIGQAKDHSKLASFLIGESNTWITGQIFNIDGGRSTVRKKG
tara:strand:- start:574 stop:1299 length:726 start_codon:yes stop_codon:yes gene_type:complete